MVGITKAMLGIRKKDSRQRKIEELKIQGIKASRHQGIKASRHQGIKASRHQGIKASRQRI
jgi:hypothetical protein